MIEIGVAVGVVAVACVVVYMLMRGRKTPVVVAGDVDAEDGVVSEPVPIAPARPAGLATAPMREITWTRQFEPRSGSLDDAARLKLIEDLAMLRAPWCVKLLEKAATEEQIPANRAAAERALARAQNVAVQ